MSYPVIPDLASDDYKKRYYNNTNYFHFNHQKNNEKFGPIKSPIILFSGSGVRKSSALVKNHKMSAKSNVSSRQLFKKRTSKSAKSKSSIFVSELSNTFCSTKNALKVLIILICCGFCFYQTIDIFKKYSAFPMDVNVIVQEMKLLHLPAITICNNNLALKSEIKDRIDDIPKNISLKELSEKTKKFLTNRPLKKIISLSPTREDFISKMECDTQFDPTDPTEDQSKKCNNKEVITSLQKNGICFTYFHKMAKYTKIEDTSDCEMLDTCVKSQSLFDTNEIIRYHLNFDPEEYTNTELPVSGRIAIHDSTEIGNSESNAYNLEPGFYYQFFIKIQSTSMLTKPYSTNCLDYLNKNTKLFEERRDFTAIPLSRKQCSSACVSAYSIKMCNCWPPELPYTLDNQLDSNQTLPWCSWRFSSGDDTLYGMCFDKTQRMKCAMNCQPNCWTDNYEISVQKLPFEYYGRKGWRSDDEKLKKCCSVVSIRYWSTEHTIHKYSPLFTILDMVCYVGGLVSMYTGMSLIAIYDFLIIIYYLTKKYHF